MLSFFIALFEILFKFPSLGGLFSHSLHSQSTQNLFFEKQAQYFFLQPVFEHVHFTFVKIGFI